MFVDDAFEPVAVEVGVPGAVGVDDSSGAFVADAKAADLGAVEDGAGAVLLAFGDALLYKGPGSFAIGGVDAVGTDADEQVAGDAVDATADGFFACGPVVLGHDGRVARRPFGGGAG